VVGRRACGQDCRIFQRPCSAIWWKLLLGMQIYHFPLWIDKGQRTHASTAKPYRVEFEDTPWASLTQVGRTTLHTAANARRSNSFRVRPRKISARGRKAPVASLDVQRTSSLSDLSVGGNVKMSAAGYEAVPEREPC
jgi:hypothetical protein